MYGRSWVQIPWGTQIFFFVPRSWQTTVTYHNIILWIGHLMQILNDYSQLSLRWTPSGPALLSVLERCPAYREFRYSKMTENWRAGTNTRCPLRESWLSMKYIALQFLTVPFNNMQTLKFKTQLTIAFFTAVNHNYNDNQQTLKKETNKMDRNLPNTTQERDLLNPLSHWSKLSFHITSVKMNDGSKKITTVVWAKFK